MSHIPTEPPDALESEPFRLHRWDEKWCVSDLTKEVPSGETVVASNLAVTFWEWDGTAWEDVSSSFEDPAAVPYESTKVRFKVAKPPAGSAIDASKILAVGVNAEDSAGGVTYSVHRLLLSGAASD